MKSSTLVSLGTSIDILRCLLEEESLALAQLTYVVDYIHTPLLRGCNPSPHPHSHDTKQQQGTSSTAVPCIVTFAQHWELFANIATLHESQATLLGRLEVAVRECTALLEQQQQWRQLQSEDMGAASEPRTARRAARRDGEEDEFDDEDSRGATDAVTVSLCSILSELFCSTTMRHYIAEHMMYSLNYSRNIAPRVLDIARLWASPNGAPGSVYTQHTPHSRPRGNLDSVEQHRLRPYFPLLRFLWNELGGEAGMPDDQRAVFVQLAETPLRWTTTTSAQQQQQQQQQSARAHTPRVGRAVAGVDELPPLPKVWRGFETLLVLLATPLASLRRYIHVGRCLIESRCLPRSIRHTLQVGFVDMATHRVVEESSIVLDELAHQDVAHIMSLMDEIPVSPGASKRPASVCPDTDGSRVLVHYGRITKKYRRGRHERLMFLFSDWLCYVEEQANSRLRLRGSIPLKSVKVIELSDVPSLDILNAFNIVTSDTRLTFFAPTPEQKQQWIVALRNTAQLHQKLTCALQSQKPTNDVTGVVCPAARPLAQSSRLRRQQRADEYENLRMDRRHCPHSTAVSTSISVQAAGTAQRQQSTTGSAAKTIKRTTGITLGVTKKRSDSENLVEARRLLQLNHGGFKVTHWAKHSTETVHVRIRSADLLPSPRSTTVFGGEVDKELGSGEDALAAARVDRASRPRETRLMSERFDKSDEAPVPGNASGVRAAVPILSPMPDLNEGDVEDDDEDEETCGTVDMKGAEDLLLATTPTRIIRAGNDEVSFPSKDPTGASPPRKKGPCHTKEAPGTRTPSHPAMAVRVQSSGIGPRNSSEFSDSGASESSMEIFVPTIVPTQKHVDPIVAVNFTKKTVKRQ